MIDLEQWWPRDKRADQIIQLIDSLIQSVNLRVALNRANPQDARHVYEAFVGQSRRKQ